MVKRIDPDTINIIKEDYKYSQKLKVKIRNYTRPALCKKYKISQSKHDKWIVNYENNTPFCYKAKDEKSFESLRIDYFKGKKLRELYKENNMIALCLRYNIDVASVSRLVNNQTYKDV